MQSMRLHIGYLLLFRLGVCVAQDTFNVVHNRSIALGWPDVGGAHARSVLPLDAGYLLFGEQVTQSTYGKPFTIRFALDGTFQFEQEWFASTSRNYDYGYIDPVLKDEFGAIASLTAFNGVNDSTGALHLIRFNDSGDSLWGVVVLDTCFCNARQIRSTIDGGVVMVGFSGFNAMFLLTDTLGNIDTLRTYPSTSDGLSVRPLQAGGYVLAGYRLGGMDNHCWVIRTDSLGDQIWRKDIGGSHFSSSNICAIQTQDGGILAASSFMPVGSFPTDPEWAYFRKWDIDGDLEWTQQYNLQYLSTCYDVEELANGSLIVTGAEISTVHGNNGIVYHLEPDGDLIWMRRYNYYGPNSGVCIPYDIEPTSDGGYVMTGAAFQGAGDSIPGLQMVWLVKTDSMGCLVPGCGGIGVEEILLGLEDALLVFPNPASTQLNARIALPPGLEPKGSFKLTLTTLDGRIVRSSVLPVLQQQQVQLDVSDLAAGAYSVHLSDDMRLLASRSVMIE